MKRVFYIHCFASFVSVKVITQKKRYRHTGSLDHAGFDEYYLSRLCGKQQVLSLECFDVLSLSTLLYENRLRKAIYIYIYIYIYLLWYVIISKLTSCVSVGFCLHVCVYK